ncbi:response regulator [Pelagibacterium sp. H642]|uniref:response regulator n=1 Tax=Pelagibacterium sp. H642 TaxID=1881069 RepID=UPI002815F12C|nr:response regulator [Pelagibacterium sp. H642]WMT92894.1 response regulator [Pelagibacterium sp. H642]
MLTRTTDSNRGRGRKILVAEDDYLIVSDLVQWLERTGFHTIGPVANLQDALFEIEHEPRLQGALLDINLGGEWSFPVADALREKGIPIVFTTGYDRDVIPDRFNDVEIFRKPIDPITIAETLVRLGEAS